MDMNKTISNIENNPYKDRVRKAIVNQAVEFGKTIHSFSLPAEHWLFEKALLSACPNADITGFEIDKKVLKVSKRNMPKGVKLIKGKIGRYIAPSAIIYSKLNYAWLDYCGTPYGGKKWGFSRIEEPAKLIRSMISRKVNGVVYVTYCMTSRTMKVKALAKMLWGGKLSIEGATKRKLWSAIGIKNGNNIRLVLEIVYLGGENEKTPMLTLGFQVGKQTITPFTADWRTEVRTARAEAHALKYGGDYIPPEQETKVLTMIAMAQHEKEKLEAMLNQFKMIHLDSKALIRMAYKQKLNTAAIYKLTQAVSEAHINIVNRNNLNRHNVGATIAWM
jgi:hypothetical protein